MEKSMLRRSETLPEPTIPAMSSTNHAAMTTRRWLRTNAVRRGMLDPPRCESFSVAMIYSRNDSSTLLSLGGTDLSAPAAYSDRPSPRNSSRRRLPPLAARLGHLHGVPRRAGAARDRAAALGRAPRRRGER